MENFLFLSANWNKTNERQLDLAAFQVIHNCRNEKYKVIFEILQNWNFSMKKGFIIIIAN